jgi:transcriptional regulator with XRE-family HTH domain
MIGERRQQFLQQFGRRVRAARILKGLSLQRCADQAGISYSNLSVIERGKRSMYVEHLPALAKALGVDVQYLLGEEDPAEKAHVSSRDTRTHEVALETTPPAKRPRPRKAAPVG